MNLDDNNTVEIEDTNTPFVSTIKRDIVQERLNALKSVPNVTANQVKMRIEELQNKIISTSPIFDFRKKEYLRTLLDLNISVLEVLKS